MTTPASKRLAQLSRQKPQIPECTLFRVHKHLRDVNPVAYEPQVISVGPYHCGKENLKMMEEHKLIYMNFLLKSKNEKFDRYVSAIKPLEKKARECYAEDIHMDPEEFIEMLVIDGCFIIQLVRNNESGIINPIPENDPIMQMDWMWNSLWRDLMLFENQIPFFILLELFKCIEATGPKRLMRLIFNFFQQMYPGRGFKDNDARNPDEIKHLLDLVHGNCLSPSHSVHIDDPFTKISNIVCARKLKEANVKFVKAANKGSLFDVEFNNGTLTMAPIPIVDNTETFFRNFIAYEQYCQSTNTKKIVTDYALLLDCLIDSSKDVEILCRAKVFRNFPGDDQLVVNMFGKLTDGVTTRSRKDFIYGTIFDKINSHCNLRRNKYVAALRHNYLSTPWTIISIVAALTVIVLTFIQTVCSILQVVATNR